MATLDAGNIKVNKHALEISRFFSQNATILILQFSLSSLLFGVLSVLALTSISLLLRRRSLRADTSIRIPLLSTIILYASTTTYMAGLIWNWASVTRIVSEVDEGISLEGYDGRASLLVLENAVLKQSWMVTIALGINIILGDAVVWWRACVIWQHRAVYYTGPVLLVLTLAFGIMGARQSDEGPLVSIYLIYGGSGFTDVAAALSLITNLAATSLIASKACFHRRRLKSYLVTSGAKTRVLKVLALFIESGSVYCVILLLVLIYQFNYEATSSLVNAGYYFTYGCLVPIVALYPTVIIVLTAVNCSPLDWGLSPLGEPSSQALPSPRSHRRESAGLTLSIIRFRPPTIGSLSTTREYRRDTLRCVTRYSGVLQSPQTPRDDACMFEQGMREASLGMQPPVYRDPGSFGVAAV